MPPVAVWAALCGGVAGSRDVGRLRASRCAGLVRPGVCRVPSPVSPDGPSRPPLRGSASHEAEGRHGARASGAGLLGPPATGRRLCVLRQIGDQLVAGLEEFLLS